MLEYVWMRDYNIHRKQCIKSLSPCVSGWNFNYVQRRNMYIDGSDQALQFRHVSVFRKLFY